MPNELKPKGIYDYLEGCQTSSLTAPQNGDDVSIVFPL